MRAGEELPSHPIPLYWLQEALAETLWAQDPSVIPVSSIQLSYPLLYESDFFLFEALLYAGQN